MNSIKAIILTSLVMASPSALAWGSKPPKEEVPELVPAPDPGTDPTPEPDPFPNGGIRIGEPGFAGNGCAAESTRVLSSDGEITILFDQFTAEAGQAVGKTLDRKNCTIAIPIHVPQGMSVAVLKQDYRGYVSLPAGAIGNFTRESFFVGSRGTVFSKNFTGPHEEQIDLSNDSSADAVVWSACGQDTILRENVAIRAQTNQSGDQALISLDEGLPTRIQWKQCQ